MSGSFDIPSLEAVRDRIKDHIRSLENARKALEKRGNYPTALKAVQLHIPLNSLLPILDKVIDNAKEGLDSIASSHACILRDKVYLLLARIEAGEYAPFGNPVRHTLLTLLSLISTCDDGGMSDTRPLPTQKIG